MVIRFSKTSLISGKIHVGNIKQKMKMVASIKVKLVKIIMV